MSKIIKHTFTIPNLVVKDGELVVENETSVTYTFTLLYKGLNLFEELAGKPLLNCLVQFAGSDDAEIISKMVDKQLIKDLAAASYIKIEGNKFHNNRATVAEFKKSQVYPIVENDYEFAVSLLSMAMECAFESEKGKKKSKEAIRPKK